MDGHLNLDGVKVTCPKQQPEGLKHIERGKRQELAIRRIGTVTKVGSPLGCSPDEISGAFKKRKHKLLDPNSLNMPRSGTSVPSHHLLSPPQLDCPAHMGPPAPHTWRNAPQVICSRASHTPVDLPNPQDLCSALKRSLTFQCPPMSPSHGQKPPPLHRSEILLNIIGVPKSLLVRHFSGCQAFRQASP